MFNVSSLRALTGDAAYKRGERYFTEGRIQIEQSTADSVTGLATGSDVYRCRLSWKNQSIRHDCTCPVGDSGECCKHVVALALTYAAQSNPQGIAPEAEDGLAGFIKSQPADWLVSTLLNIADQHPEIARQLNLQRQLSGKMNIAELKKTVSSLVGRAKFMDYRQSRNYAARVHELADFLDQLTKAGQADATLTLIEYAFPKLRAIYEQSDDSGGYLGGELAHIAKLYLEASNACSPLGDDYPRRLYKLMLEDEWGMFNIKDFSPALGEKGLAEWQRLLEADWASQNANPSAEETTKQWRVNHMMEALAKQRGDVDFLLRIYSQDLSNPYNYLQIVEMYLLHKRPREAMQWAERANKAHPDDTRLRTKLAELYQSDGFSDEATALYWLNFLSHASPENYLTLKKSAANAWPDWRMRAMDAMITSEQHHFKNPKRFYQYGYQQHSQRDLPDCSIRVACLLAEAKDNPDAITEAREALKNHQCNLHPLLELADRIKQDHPEEAVRYMQAAVTQYMQISNNQNYQLAADLITKIKPLMAGDAFNLYLEAIRKEYKAKRNFMAMLQTV